MKLKIFLYHTTDYFTKIQAFLKNLYFPIFCGIGSVIYGMQFFTIPAPEMLTNYGNDFLCMPIVLSICQLSMRILRSDPAYLIPIPLLLLVTLIFCVYFEMYLPLQNPRYTADFIDVVLYFSGTLFFYGVEYHANGNTPS